MAQRSTAVTAPAATLLAILVAASLLSIAAAGAAEQPLGWIPSRSGCRGSIEDCLSVDNEEFLMDSEVSRRILATSRYISYQALKRGSTPCSVKGASYYNCRPGAQANPYRRGCSRIARCRS